MSSAFFLSLSSPVSRCRGIPKIWSISADHYLIEQFSQVFLRTSKVDIYVRLVLGAGGVLFTTVTRGSERTMNTFSDRS